MKSEIGKIGRCSECNAYYYTNFEKICDECANLEHTGDEECECTSCCQ